jgi:hypothetical protein
VGDRRAGAARTDLDAAVAPALNGEVTHDEAVAQRLGAICSDAPTPARRGSPADASTWTLCGSWSPGARRSAGVGRRGRQVRTFDRVMPRVDLLVPFGHAAQRCGRKAR